MNVRERCISDPATLPWAVEQSPEGFEAEPREFSSWRSGANGDGGLPASLNAVVIVVSNPSPLFSLAKIDRRVDTGL
jgi:hypothetical protein